MKAKKYGIKVLSIAMNALGVVAGVETGAYPMGAISLVLLVEDLRDLKAMVLKDLEDK